MELPNLGSFDPRSIKGFNPGALKNFSLDDAKDFFRNKKLQVLAIAILLAGAGGAVYLFNTNTVASQLIDDQKKTLQERIAPIKNLKVALKDQASFLESLSPSLGEENFISVLADIAKKRNIRITDFTPPTTLEEKYYKKLTSKFVCTTTNFHNAILFINDLEKGKYAIEIESWTIRPQQKKSQTGILGSVDISATQEFRMDLKVASYKIEPDIKVKPKK